MSHLISKNRRKEIKAMVLGVLNACETLTLPINIKNIVKTFHNIRLIPYSKHMKKFNLSYGEMLEFSESTDGCTDYSAKRDLYIIYYNDVDSSLINSNRYRWTIAHELGHIMLDHHKISDRSKIYRNSLDYNEYRDLEREADYFAALILVPHIVLFHRKKPVTNKWDLAKICLISQYASTNRFNDYRKWQKNRNPHSGYDQELLDLFCKYMYKVECPNCLNQMYYYKISHCIYCGETNLKWIGDGKMIYDKFAFTECPHCKNEDINEDDNFCIICKENLQNYCTNNDCKNYFLSIPLPKNARYCPHCGAETTFFQKRFLQAWDYEPEDAEFAELLSQYFPDDDSNTALDVKDDDFPF